MSARSAAILLVGALGPSLIISWAAALVVRRSSLAWGWVDRPGRRKVHEQPTPLGGGLAIWLGVVGALAIGHIALWLMTNGGSAAADLEHAWIPEFAKPHVPGLLQQSGRLWVLLSAGTVLMAVGLIDDLRGLDWRIRLAVQFAVAGFCVAWQGWRLTAFIDLPAATWLLSVLWIVALVNSFNMLDNMDGASAGVAAIAAAILAAVLLSPNPTASGPQLFVGGFLLVLLGSLIGFLWHNRPPARIFMGDAGSYFVGFCVAAATLLATFASYHSGRPHAVLAPLCVMAVPLYDTATVVWIRLREGRSPFEADRNHFSHRLVELGMNKSQAVLTLYLTTATTGLGALALRHADEFGASIILLMILCVLLLIAVLEITARRKLRR